MAYTATTWTDGSTPVNASNMNKIESGLSDQDSRITALENRLIPSSQSAATASDVLEFAEGCSNGLTYFCTGTDTSNLPSTASSWQYATGIVMRRSTSVIQVLLISNSGTIATVPYNNTTGGWGSWRMYSYSS